MFTKFFTIEDFCNGICKNWISFEEALSFIIENHEHYNLDLDTLLSIENKQSFIDSMCKFEDPDTFNKISCNWLLHFLLPIKNAKISVNEKNILIESYWAMFNYPKDWQEFIYYMPNNNTFSPEDVYKNFESFIIKVEKSCD